MLLGKPICPAMEAIWMTFAFTLFQHFRNRPLGGEKTAFQVDVNGIVPEFLRMMGQIGADQDAGAIDQDIQPSEFFHRLRHHPVHIGNIGDIPGDGQGFSALFLDLIGDPLLKLVHSSAGYGHLGPFLGEFQGDSPANALCLLRLPRPLYSSVSP